METENPSEAAKAAPDHVPVPGTQLSRPARNLSLALAGGWLLLSVIAGVLLILGGPDSDKLAAKAPDLSASAEHAAYGGDAYTGIQNAAADTEHAVVEGLNAVAELELAIAQDDAANWQKVRLGLGVLIISLGVINMNVAVTRSANR